MKNSLWVLLVALLVSACEGKEESRARNEQKLPPGCKIIDLDYGDLRAAVVCEGRKTSTSLRSWHETVMVPMYNAALGMTTMQPQIHYYRHISAEISARD